MANNPSDGADNDFLEQILGIQTFSNTGGDPNLAGTSSGAPMFLQLSSGEVSDHLPGSYHQHQHQQQQQQQQPFPLGLSLEQSRGGFFNPDEAISGVKRFSNDLMDNARPNSSKNVFHGQPVRNHVPVGGHQPTIRPRVRARRGQATDPHSIAERLRRERIAERIRALQELVPSVNKTDRAAMLDEIVDYVKFLRLQVKVLSMSRLGGAAAVAPLVADMPMSSLDQEEGGRDAPAWERWSSDGTEQQVAKMMEENVGGAMQFLQSKQLCIMPISLAAAIYHTQPSEASSSQSFVKPEPNPPS